MPTLGTTDFWTYVLGVVFAILLPRPDSLFVLATSAQRGVATGYRAACGVFLGSVVLMLLSTLGVAPLLKVELMLLIGLKYLDAAYLFYLGVGMLRGAWRKLRNPEATMAQAEQVGVHQPFCKALLLSLSNPKATLFSISFSIQFVDPGYAYPGLSFLMLTVILELVSVLYLSFLIFTGVRLAAQSRRWQRLAAGATSGVGALLVGFGVKLATATLS